MLICFTILITSCNTLKQTQIQELNMLNSLRPSRPFLIEKEDADSLKINCIRLITCVKTWENYARAIDEFIEQVGTDV